MFGGEDFLRIPLDKMGTAARFLPSDSEALLRPPKGLGVFNELCQKQPEHAERDTRLRSNAYQGRAVVSSSDRLSPSPEQKLIVSTLEGIRGISVECTLVPRRTSDKCLLASARSRTTKQLQQTSAGEAHLH